MPGNKAANLLGIYPQRLWTIFNYWISIAYDSDNQSEVRNIGIDETSIRKGHKYVTIAADMDKRRASGFTNADNFINMNYFFSGKLKFDYPRYFT